MDNREIFELAIERFLSLDAAAITLLPSKWNSIKMNERHVPVSLSVHFPPFLGDGLVQVPVRIDPSRSRIARNQIVVADEFHLDVVLVIRFRQCVLA